MPVPSEQTKTHVDYFDWLRVMATICVIFMHAAAALVREPGGLQWELLNVCISFAFTAVPLFLMMSGFLLLSNERTTDMDFLLRKRLPRLVLPLVGWTVIALLQRLGALHFLNWENFRLGLVQSLFQPAAVHFWYMYLLIGLYVLSPFLYGAFKCLDSKGHQFALTLIGLVTVQEIALVLLPEDLQGFANIDLVLRLKLYEGHLCTFILGYYLGNLERRIPNKVLIPAAVGLWAVIAGGTHVLTMEDGSYNAAFQNQGAGLEVLLAGCLFLLFKQNADWAPAFFRKIPIVPLSLPIYFMHGIVLAAVQDAGIYSGNFLEVAGMTLFLFAVSYLGSKTLASVKPLCYLFTGMSWEAACGSCNWVFTYRNIRARFQRQTE